MPSIEMNNGQVHQVVDVETTAGAIRRIEAARATSDREGKAKQSEFARFKDQDGDTIGVNPDNVSSVY